MLGKTRRWGVLSLVVVMLLVTGAAIRLLASDGFKPLGKVEQDCEAVSNDGNSTLRSRSSGNVVPRQTANVAPWPDTKPIQVSLRFVTKERTPLVAGVEVEVRVQRDIGDSAPLRDWLSLRTDSAGSVSFSAPVPGGAVVRMKSSNWSLEDSVEGEERVWWMLADAVEIRVAPVLCVVLRVKYSDGLPFFGYLRFDQDGEAPREIRTGPDGLVEFTTASANSAKIRVESRRGGFSGTSSTFSTARSAGEPFDVVLPPGDPLTGVIEIDLALLPSTSLFSISVNSAAPPDYPLQNRASYWAEKVRGGSIHTTTPLPPGDFTVDIREQSGGGRQGSGTIPSIIATKSISLAVFPLQTTRFQPLPRVSCAARIRIVGTDGKPLVPAELRVKSAGYQRWDAVRYQPGLTSATPPCGYSDEEGYALAAGIMVETRLLVAEAPGYEPKEIDILPVEGGVLDLGSVVLEKALGIVELSIEGVNASADADYEVCLLQPLGSIVFGPARFKGTNFRIGQLPLRRYTVSIKDLSGLGAAYSQNITLSNGEPLALVTFVMRKWPFDDDEK